ENDILIAKITPCFENGKGALAKKLINGVGFGSTEFHVVRTIDGINEKWLHYLTNSYFFRKRGELNMQGSAGQQRIPTDFVSTYFLPKPPKNEQDKIVNIISTWDKTISIIENLIQAKKRYKKGLMQQLLTGKKRFPEFEGEEWVEVKLGEVFTERKEKECSHLDLVAITTERGVIDRDKLDRKDTSSSNKDNYKRIAPGDIGYNTMRMWQGVSGYSELEGIISSAYTIVTPIDEKIDGRFMSYLFKHPPVIDLFRRYSQGLVSDTLNLKFNNFAQIKVVIPRSIKEQKKIAKVFMTIDKEVKLLYDKLEIVKKQKKGLMQQLLTGKVRVKEQLQTENV